jgi:inosose dehydratase
MNRRDFLATTGTLVSGLALPADLFGQPAGTAAKGPFEIRFAYHAITWGGNDIQAIEEIAGAGFKGIQLRSNVVKEYGDKPAALKAMLDTRGLTLVCFSSGNVRLAPEAEEETLAQHTRHAQFVRDLGGLFLQVTDERPKGRTPGPDDFKRMGGLLTKLGKRCADLGVTLAYHNHMNNLGEKPEEVAGVLAASDPSSVKLLLDMAHYQQGGGDPVKAVSQYRDRLGLLHFKDLISNPDTTNGGGTPARPYKFVELGQGKVDIPGVVDALKAIGYRGWGVIELDAVPVPNRTPKESMHVSQKYVRETLKLTV